MHRKMKCRRSRTKNDDARTKSSRACGPMEAELSCLPTADRTMATTLLLNGRTFNVERAELRDASGRPIELRPHALAVLLELARRPGEVVTKRDLMARVWPGVAVTDDSLVRCVVEIRRVLGDSGQRIVRTMPRRGLRADLRRGLPAEDSRAGGPEKAHGVAIVAAAVVASLLAWQLAESLSNGAWRRACSAPRRPSTSPFCRCASSSGAHRMRSRPTAPGLPTCLRANWRATRTCVSSRRSSLPSCGARG